MSIEEKIKQCKGKDSVPTDKFELPACPYINSKDFRYDCPYLGYQMRKHMVCLYNLLKEKDNAN